MSTGGKIRVRVGGRVLRFPEKIKTECTNCRNATPWAIDDRRAEKEPNLTKHER